MGLMVLRVRPTPTNIPFTPMDNTPLHSIPSVLPPRGTLTLRKSAWLQGSTAIKAVILIGLYLHKIDLTLEMSSSGCV